MPSFPAARQFRVFAFCSLLVLSVDVSSAAEAEQEKPSRSIRFVIEDEPFVVSVAFDDQPKEGDLRYAAIVRGFAPLLINDTSPAATIDFQAVPFLALFDRSASGSRLRKLTDNSQPSGPRPSHRFRASLEEDHDSALSPPTTPHVTIHGQPANALFNLQGIPPRGQHYKGRHFVSFFAPAHELRPVLLQQYALLASNVEDAKQFAQDFLHVYDAGFIPWLATFVPDEQVAIRKTRAEAAPKLAALEDAVQVATAKLGDIEPLGDAAVSDLKVKRTLLKVELAGVKARISSIEDKLKGDRAGGEPARKLTELKIAADVDLAALAAQQKVLDELIEGQRKLAEVARLRQEMRPLKDTVATADEALKRCEEILADAKPFNLLDDTIVIRPVRFKVE